MDLLGQIVDKHGVHVDKEKISKIKWASPPPEKKELHAFFGLASKYRRLIPGFANISKPPNDNTSEKEAFIWTDET